MKKKLTTERISTIHRILLNSSYDGLKGPDYISFIRVRRALKDHAEKHESFIQEVTQKEAPEGFDEIVRKYQHILDLPEAERIEVTKTVHEVEARLAELTKIDREQEIEVEFRAVSEDALGQFFAANSKALPMVVADMLFETLGEPDAPATPESTPTEEKPV